MNRKFAIFFCLIIFIFFTLPFSAQALNLKNAFLTKDQSDKDPLDNVAGTAGYNIKSDLASAATPFTIVAKIINTLLSILGVFFVGLMVYSGYTWMTAEGKEQKVTKARDTITAAVIGSLIIASAYAISYFVIKVLADKALSTPSTTEVQDVPDGTKVPESN